jgi:hypothetical protein
VLESPAEFSGSRTPCTVLVLPAAAGRTHSRGVSDWLHGPYWVSSTGVTLVTWTIRPTRVVTPGGCQIGYVDHTGGYVDHTGRHQLVF